MLCDPWCCCHENWTPVTLSKVATVLHANLSQSVEETANNAFSGHLNLPFGVLDYARRTTHLLSMSPFEHFWQLSLHSCNIVSLVWIIPLLSTHSHSGKDRRGARGQGKEASYSPRYVCPLSRQALRVTWKSMMSKHWLRFIRNQLGISIQNTEMLLMFKPTVIIKNNACKQEHIVFYT